jgi:hypothetical protein
MDKLMQCALQQIYNNHSYPEIVKQNVEILKLLHEYPIFTELVFFCFFPDLTNPHKATSDGGQKRNKFMMKGFEGYFGRISPADQRNAAYQDLKCIFKANVLADATNRMVKKRSASDPRMNRL